MTDAELDPQRFVVHHFEGRGFRQAYVRENAGGVPLLCVHGWPETKRIWWRVIELLAAAGFEVVVPDLRGFGDSDVGPDGFHDVPSHSRDLHVPLLGPPGRLHRGAAARWAGGRLPHRALRRSRQAAGVLRRLRVEFVGDGALGARDAPLVSATRSFCRDLLAA